MTAFTKLAKLKIDGGNIYSFGDYKIYMIPSTKLQLGISPLIDSVINKDLDLSIYCKRSTTSISKNYIYEILTKDEFYMFFLTKNITEKQSQWVNEDITPALIDKIKALDLSNIDDIMFVNGILKQIGEPSMAPAVKNFKFLHDKEKAKIIAKLEPMLIGGAFQEKLVNNETLLSFMFISKTGPNDYYINVRCSNPFTPQEKEYKFPWSTYFLYIFLKSMGNRSINLYNHASNKSVTYYHKRFLFNLGKKNCDESNDIYNASNTIPFDILNGPNTISKAQFTTLLDSLPDDYEVSSGFKMKFCDSLNPDNVTKINNLGKYLEKKWYETIAIDDIEILTNTIITKRSRINNINSTPKKLKLNGGKLTKTKSKSKKYNKKTKKSKK